MPGWVKYEREHKPAVAGILHKPAVAGILHKPAVAGILHKPSRNGGRGAPHRQKKERMEAQEDVLKE